jgi:hypothetical protein
MRRVLIVLALAAAMLGAIAPAANAGVVCAVEHKLGFDNVKDCEIPL